ncbi:MAG: HAMP domain-containing methyl-accepting chemotaxis protein [Pseudomonadota bacterium]
MNYIARLKKKNWITVGGKLTLGLALVSNLCIGAMLTANWTMNTRLDTITRDLMTIKDDLNSDLRKTVLDIQEKYLKIPAFLAIDPTGEILAMLAGTYPVNEDTLLKGRDDYRDLFDRKERRDLSKGGFVIQKGEGKIFVSVGLLDGSGEFTGSVRRIAVQGNDTEYAAISDTVQAIIARGSGEYELKQRIADLGAMLADEGLKAEETRTRILQFVDTITAREKAFAQKKIRFDELALILGIATVVVNILALFIMARLIVERPLRKLSSIIARIRNGETPDIPFQSRRDEIGALAGAVKNFGELLTRMRDDEIRKQQEQSVIGDVIRLMTQTIKQQRTGSQEMTFAASRLNSLAMDTREQSSSVTETASRTAENTRSVSEAAGNLRVSARQTLDHLGRQHSLVREIARDTQKSRANIDSLTRASDEIQSIISLVRDIADRTRLLALNATIEAARAGEKGRGFAVVAQEVKDLSRQTEQATQEVSKKISLIRDETGIIMSSIGTIDGKIEHLSSISLDVNAAVEAQQRFTEDIAAMTASTSKETRDVSQCITQVEQAALSTLELSGTVREHSESISRSMVHLLDETTRRLQPLGNEQAA